MDESVIDHQPGWVGRALGAWVGMAYRWPRLVLAVLLGLMLLSAVGASQLRIDADSSAMLSSDLPAQARAHALNRTFPGLKSAVLIVVEADRSDTADLAVRALVDGLERETAWIERVFAPAVDPFMAAHGFLYRPAEEVDEILTRLSKSANMIAALREDQTVDGFLRALAEAGVLAERAEIGPDALARLHREAAEVLAADRTGVPRRFAWSALLENEPPSKRTIRVITVTPRLDPTRLSPARPALDAIRGVVAMMDPALGAEVDVSITGEPALRAEEMASVVDTIGLSLGGALILVMAILWIGLRSLRQAIASLGCVVVGIVLTLGITGVTIGALNLVSVAFVVLMVGLGIDFAVHLLAHVSEMRRDGVTVSDAMRLSAERIGLALVLAGFTTAAAFLAFTTTAFAGMAQLGAIGAIGVMVALGVTVTLIPALTALFPGRVPRAAPRPIVGAPVWRHAPVAALAIGLVLLVPASNVRFDADPVALRDPASGSVDAFRTLARDPDRTPYRASVLAPDAEAAAEIAARLVNLPGIAAALSIADLVPEDQDDKLTTLDFAAPSIELALDGEAEALAGLDVDADPLAALRATLADTSEAAALGAELQAYAERRSDATDGPLGDRIFSTFPMLLDRLGAMLEADYVTAETVPAAMTERFRAPDGTHRVEVLPQEDLRDPAALDRFATTVLEAAPDAAGGPVQLWAAGKTVSTAMVQAVLLAALTTAVLAYAVLRRASDVFAVLLPLVLAEVAMAAGSFLLGVPFNYANVIVLPLVIGIGVDSGIHVALRERQAPGAVLATSTGRAVVVSALTTVAAFSTLAISDHRGTASMGILLTVAVLAALLFVFALTPAVIRATRALTLR